MAKAPLKPLLIHAVIPGDGRTAPAGVEIVPFRELAAVVSPAPAAPPVPREALLAPPLVEEHRRVIEAYHREGALLPAPTGTVAKGADCVVRWLELHYLALREALEFVEDRCAARVHVTRAVAPASSERPLETAPLDLDGVAAEVFGSLRRHAAAAVTLRQPASEAQRATAAFLVESDRWRAFTEAVKEEGRRDATLRVELSGPWPPYDFVKMQFGG